MHRECRDHLGRFSGQRPGGAEGPRGPGWGTGRPATLSMAAVIGQEFDIDVLASAAESVRTTYSTCSRRRRGLRWSRRLTSRSVGTASRMLWCSKPSTLGLSPTRRTRAHARVAAAMETLGGREPGELAYHYLAGMTPPRSKERSTMPEPPVNGR